MGIFDGIETVRAMNSSPYFPAGFDGVCMNDVCKVQNGHKGTTFIAEFEVITSNLQEVEEGAHYAWFQKLDGDKRLTGLAAIKGFLFASLGNLNGDPRLEARLPQVTEFVCSPDNPLMGSFVKIQTFNKQTKAKTDFTRHNFYPVEEAPYDLENFLVRFNGPRIPVQGVTPPPAAYGAPPPPVPVWNGSAWVSAPPPPPPPPPAPVWNGSAWVYR